MEFNLFKTDAASKARAGMVVTDHGSIPTPAFMPVGTAGTVKAVHQRELECDINAKIILGNTYHLYLKPGIELIKKAGGLHKFNSWKRPLLTDSGGYQVYSLSEQCKINEEGVTFRSHIDGSKHIFTPESVVEMQRGIGADIMMVFDECTPYPCRYDYVKKSMHLTHRWLKRGIHKFNTTAPQYGYEQSLFSIVQGGLFGDLRDQSAEFVAELDLPGHAIGGLSVGEPPELMYSMTERVCALLPQGKPRYLMGVGTPTNILECIALGVDMFDCVMPTRNARNGMLFTTQGIINIRNKKWEYDMSPIDYALGGEVSTRYSKAYLRHLIISHEILGAQIASVHNLTFYIWLVEQAREKIMSGDFLAWKNTMINMISKRM